MLVVRQQHRVDRAERGRGQHRPAGLGQDPVADRVVARGVERRVGDQPEPADLDHRGRPTEVADAHEVVPV
jgi:hypothetical protein